MGSGDPTGCLEHGQCSPAGHDHARINEFLLDYDFSASYDIRWLLCERLLGLDFNKLWLVRLLMTV